MQLPDVLPGKPLIRSTPQLSRDGSSQGNKQSQSVEAEKVWKFNYWFVGKLNRIDVPF